MTRIINGERRYGIWAGCPQGQREELTRCIEKVWPANSQQIQIPIHGYGW